MTRRLKIIIAYDGAPFAGWQSQSHRNTIQDHLESAFERVTGTPVRVHGAGRTDAGVHALAQCAHVDLANKLCRPRVGRKRSMRYCLRRYACFAADMCRRISTRVFRQKVKFIATEFGARLFYLRSSTVAPGTSPTRSI